MSFFVSDDIKDLISEDQLNQDVSIAWDAYASSSEKAYKILELQPEQDHYIVKLEVSGSDISMFLKHADYVKALHISNEKFVINGQELIKFSITQQSGIYIVETYLRSA